MLAPEKQQNSLAYHRTVSEMSGDNAQHALLDQQFLKIHLEATMILLHTPAQSFVT
ncbi:hypothetical protein W01_04280 [Candidatus Nitrotoga sp. AM1P]|nr:hypothetical protein W01_04280 [Candidatus Nitrotoga sp. AM1P]